MAVDADLVRLLIGDADTESQLLTDDQITALTASFSSSTLAAAACADAIAAKFSRKVSFSLEGLRFENSTKAQAYLNLAQRLRSQAALTDAGGLGASVMGVSKSEMQTVDDDTDREPSRFKTGMQEFPGTLPRVLDDN